MSLLTESDDPIQTRVYGNSGPCVVLLHGGPGAPGYMEPIARKISDAYRVFEPLARGSRATPLTVGIHVEDLARMSRSRFPAERAVWVGHSWGAMLALAHASAHPEQVGALVLVGCGTFDESSRARLRAVRELRMSAATRRRIDSLIEEEPDPDRRMAAIGNLLVPVDSHDPVTMELGMTSCDARAYRETWADMMRLQEERIYPAAFGSIMSPVLMLHGADDPHPGRMIHASLKPHLARLEYREWPECGHYPWFERAVGEEFYSVLREWLERNSRDPVKE